MLQEDLNENIAEMFFALHFLKLKMKKNNKFDHCITEQKTRVLVTLNLLGKSRLKDIASEMFVSTSSLCIMLNQLEKENFVLREVDEFDRRNTYYTATQSGIEVCNDVESKNKEMYKKMMNNLEYKDKEILLKSLIDINEIVKKLI